jgi:hypothetical protein
VAIFLANAHGMFIKHIRAVQSTNSESVIFSFSVVRIQSASFVNYQFPSYCTIDTYALEIEVETPFLASRIFPYP